MRQESRDMFKTYFTIIIGSQVLFLQHGSFLIFGELRVEFLISSFLQKYVEINNQKREITIIAGDF